MFPNINAMQIQVPIVFSEENESESILTPTKRCQVASVETFKSVAKATDSGKSAVPIGTVIPAVEAVHWSIGDQNCDIRPRLTDKSTGVERLLDTGSQISTTQRRPDDKEDESFRLIAVNGSKIKTYGK